MVDFLNIGSIALVAGLGIVAVVAAVEEYGRLGPGADFAADSSEGESWPGVADAQAPGLGSLDETSEEDLPDDDGDRRDGPRHGDRGKHEDRDDAKGGDRDDEDDEEDA